jgi:large subunit ribosomal protein L15
MSMQHQVTGSVPRYKKPTRKGRGRSAGKGKTAGKGTKGTKARVGKYIRRGYEGGQTEIFRRFPKRGFSNVNFANRYYIVNLGDLAARFEDGATVDAVSLAEKGLIPDSKLPVKILGDGEFTKKLTVQAGWYSRTAHTRIVDAGGAAQDAKGETFAFPKPKKKFVPRGDAKKGKKADAEAPAADAKAPEPQPDAK